VTALALATAGLPDGDSAARLEALLDDGFLAGIGWDGQTMMLSVPASHPELGWPVCQVPGCDGIAETRKGTTSLCAACAHYMARTGTSEVPAACAKTYTIGVGRCMAGCSRPWESRRRPLCAAHDHQQRVVLKLTVEEFLARPGVVPLPGFGPCRVLACRRLRHSGKSLFCKAHLSRWRRAARSDPRLRAEQWRRTEPAVAEGGTISLRGLPRLVVAEILYGLQRRCAEGVKTHRAVLRPLCDDLRRTQAGSITELPARGRRQRRYLLRSLADHCRLAMSSPDAEQEKDAWDLRVFGHRGSLDFTVIRLGWLREAAKRWASEDLPRRRGRNAANIWQYTLSSLTELDASLRLQRDDHGSIPALLGRRDIVAFTSRLAFLQQSGTLSLNRRIDILRHTRTVLTCARLAGLTRPGQAVAGLPDDFGLLKEDVPRKDRGDEPGRALPAEIMRQLCDGLPKIAEITACEEVRVAIELLMDTGRRPEEGCDLPWDCLERDKNGKYVLVYDNLKCQRRRRELPITDATAKLITGQQQRVRARYPSTPVAELKLLPAPKMNPRGTKPLRTATLNENHRAWVDALPALMIRHGSALTEFDKAAVFPYAYRHTYAQRHADAGVPVDVLRELLDHDSMDTTRIYYRIGAERQREAVDKVTRHQFDRHGNHIWHQARALLDAAHTRQVIGQVAVPYGVCTEPSNVQAGGGACPFRFRCAGCDHFRTDVSYLPDLKAYLHDLLRDRERVLAATELDDWARTQALPSEEEIRRIRALIDQAEAHLGQLTDDERAGLQEAARLVRRGRQAVSLGMPRVRQPAPDLRLERTS
jgi:site-specific recombinase XerD